MEGYLPRTDPVPRPPSSTCDTAGGCQRWNFDASPPLSDFVDYYMPPFRSAVQRAKVASNRVQRITSITDCTATKSR